MSRVGRLALGERLLIAHVRWVYLLLTSVWKAVRVRREVAVLPVVGVGIRVVVEERCLSHHLGGVCCVYTVHDVFTMVFPKFDGCECNEVYTSVDDYTKVAR